MYILSLWTVNETITRIVGIKGIYKRVWVLIVLNDNVWSGISLLLFLNFDNSFFLKFVLVRRNLKLLSTCYSWIVYIIYFIKHLILNVYIVYVNLRYWLWWALIVCVLTSIMHWRHRLIDKEILPWFYTILHSISLKLAINKTPNFLLPSSQPSSILWSVVIKCGWTSRTQCRSIVET